MSVDALLKLDEELEILLRKKAGQLKKLNAKHALKYDRPKCKEGSKQALRELALQN
jgi:hypothetical protein